MTILTLDYALMAGAAYYSTRHPDNRVPFPANDGWLPLDEAAHLDHRVDAPSGFEAVAFINQATHEIVIGYAGTNGIKDITGDWFQGNMANAAGLPSTQTLLAAKYYQDIKKLYGTYDISFTGHSLGGGLAALMGVFFNKKAVTFDAAPFRAAASMFNQGFLLVGLSNYPLDTDLVNFYNLGLGIRGEGKVSGSYVDGEFLTQYVNPLTGRSRIGIQQSIPHGPAGTASTIDLHDIELLIALDNHPVIGSAHLPFLLGDLYNTNLFLLLPIGSRPNRRISSPT